MIESSDDAIAEWWIERAAIIEFHGGRGRENAEKLAAICVRRKFGRVPNEILEKIKEKG